MRVDEATFTARPWRIHELTRDFRVEDVWALPTPGGPHELSRLVELMTTSNLEAEGSTLVRALWALRWKLGEWLGWDGTEPALDDRAATLRDRLPADLHGAPTGPPVTSMPFRALYLLHDEWAAEIANATMRGVLHIGWVPDPERGGYRGEMAVLVKPNGGLGRIYMAAIMPFRRLVIYPQMLARIEREWRAREHAPAAIVAEGSDGPAAAARIPHVPQPPA